MMKKLRTIITTLCSHFGKIASWIVRQAKTKSWRRHVALLFVAIPLIMQRFGVGKEALDLVNQIIPIITGKVSDDVTIATTIAGTIFYIYGWLKRKKAP